MSTSDEVLEIPIITHDPSLPPSYYIYNTLCEHNLYLLLTARMLPTDGPPTALALRLANDDLILSALRSETTTTHISPQELILSSSTPSGNHRCASRGRGLVSTAASKLLAHGSRTRHKRGAHQCSECGGIFKRVGDMTRHLKRHSGEVYMYVCSGQGDACGDEGCGLRYTRKDSLYRHWKAVWSRRQA